LTGYETGPGACTSFTRDFRVMDLADSEEDPLLLYQVTYAGCKRRRSKEVECGYFRALSKGCEPSNDDHVANFPQDNITYYNSENVYFEQKHILVSPTMACHFRQLKQYDLGK
jgi:hypothetical protein